MEFQERTAPAKCPLCRERCDTRDLRPNKALEGLASAVQVARALLIALASSAKAPPVREQPARAAKRPRTTAPAKPTPEPRDPEQVPDSSESQASSLAESSFSPSLSQSQPTAAKGCMVRHPSTQSVPRMQVTTVEGCVGIVYPSNVDHPPLVLQFDMLQIGAPTPGRSQAVHSSPSLMATASQSIEQPYTALHAAITAASSGSGHLTATARPQGPEI